MKFIMGMAQAIFGLIWIGIIALFLVIGITTIMIKEAINFIKKIGIHKIKDNKGDQNYEKN